MVQATRIRKDAKTGEITTEKFEHTSKAARPEAEVANHQDILKLLEHARQEGWI